MLAHRMKKSKPAFVLLTLTGIALIFLSAAVLVSGCFLIYHDNFEDSPALKEKIEIQFDYSHYWLGGSYLMAAVLTLISACRQNRRKLTFFTTVVLTIAMMVSLFAIVLDGPDWIEWKNVDRAFKYYKNKNNYTCSSLGNSCSCKQNNRSLVRVSDVSDCDDVIILAAIYGIIVGGAVVGLITCLASLLVMVNSLSWKNPWRAFPSYTASYENKGAIPSFNDVMELYRGQSTAHPTIESRSTSSIERRNKEYMPAWSLYGSTGEEIHQNPDSLGNRS